MDFLSEKVILSHDVQFKSKFSCILRNKRRERCLRIKSGSQSQRRDKRTEKLQ